MLTFIGGYKNTTNKGSGFSSQHEGQAMEAAQICPDGSLEFAMEPQPTLDRDRATHSCGVV
jgi:hypothetical protein